MIHFHARCEDESTTTDPAAYRAIAERIRAAGCDAVLNISAGDDGGRADHVARLGVADAGVEMVSLDAGSFNIGERLYDNRPSYLRNMARRMLAAGITPEIEVFDYGHMQGVRALLDDRLLTTPLFVQFVFGPPGALPADPRLLPLLLEQLPPGSEWAVSSQARDHEAYLRMTLPAFCGGGHVRTGVEDFVHVRPGVLARSNAEMVSQWVDTAAIWGRPVATPGQARSMLGIKDSTRAGRGESERHPAGGTTA